MKTVYDLHRFWKSMSAIFGFTFHIGRMTEVLTPDIYIELTATIGPLSYTSSVYWTRLSNDLSVASMQIKYFPMPKAEGN